MGLDEVYGYCGISPTRSVESPGLDAPHISRDKKLQTTHGRQHYTAHNTRYVVQRGHSTKMATTNRQADKTPRHLGSTQMHGAYRSRDQTRYSMLLYAHQTYTETHTSQTTSRETATTANYYSSQTYLPISNQNISAENTS